MPRWSKNHVKGKWRICPVCGGKKDFNAKACRKCTVHKKPLLGKKGAQHPTWKGGFRIDDDGYIRTYAPDHPWPRRGGYVHEHVRVMELHIGRRIKRSEVVHHINKNRQDNRLENLELMNDSEHSALHRKIDKHLYVKDSRGRYAGKEVARG